MEKQAFWKRILIIDDDPDITFTLKEGIEDSSKKYNADNKKIEVRTYNDPLDALSAFEPNLYDLLLIDINLPGINGFQMCEKILEIDINVKVCFMSSREINSEALREIHPTISFGCFIKKPITMDYLIERIRAELD